MRFAAMAASASSIDITKYTGKWKPNVSKSDDFEPFLAEAGVPWLVRKAIKRSAPITELAVTGTTFRAVVNSGSGKANEGTFGEVRGRPCARDGKRHRKARPAVDRKSASLGSAISIRCPVAPRAQEPSARSRGVNDGHCILLRLLLLLDGNTLRRKSTGTLRGAPAR